MKLQIIQDSNGNNTGVFIPMSEWNLIESTYPNITNLSDELPNWQKDLIDKRLDAISQNPERIMPIESLFAELNKEM